MTGVYVIIFQALKHREKPSNSLGTYSNKLIYNKIPSGLESEMASSLKIKISTQIIFQENYVLTTNNLRLFSNIYTTLEIKHVHKSFY